ncbi:hypothetical protein FNW02_06555 [Komarekiella sp. 'clone 1']|uniref:Uncharacterized protein n=1 Tax=Komarekiella delphini-convector SJRDD-AB1 TaxID=2593771 RepID=A0AA40VPN6_9NOST|nr:hypothetical protein [Komarekiella delphini-convector]MBD6615507.1 hypothetical protein [Komarekiella delphini-convector SJRDD-AB1]
MKFNSKEQNLPQTQKTKITLNDLGMEWEKLSDEVAATINGGRVNIILAPTTSTFTLNEYYKLAGFWGG